MSDKVPFTFLIRDDERAELKRLAKSMDRSEGATLRLLIRQATRDLETKNTRDDTDEAGVLKH